MSELIYQGRISTAKGPTEVRITDTAPDSRTPPLSRKSPHGGITLEMGDAGDTVNGFPTSIGSFFTLRLPDPNRRFQDAFRRAFDDERFEVDLDVPSVGTWRGYVKSTLQTRPITQETRNGVTGVKCFDGLAAIDADDTAINARVRSVREFLVEAFEGANDRLDIIASVDVQAQGITGATRDLSALFPVSGNARSFIPPTPNGPDGAGGEDGLDGDTLRAQLDDLCARLGAVAYQDVRQEAWAFMDVASIGAAQTAERYDGSSWASFPMPRQEVATSGQAGAQLLDENNEALKTRPSLRAVCAEIENHLTDPGFEATETGSDLVYWQQTDVQRNSDGFAALQTDSTGAGIEQTVDFSGMRVYDQIDAIRLVPDRPQYQVLEVEIFYGDGTSQQASTTGSFDAFYREKDTSRVIGGGGQKDAIDAIRVRAKPKSGEPIETLELNLLQQLTEGRVDPNGRDNKYSVVSTVCFTPEGSEAGRTEAEQEVGGFLASIDGQDGKAPVASWQSARYGSFNRFERWRATNLLALRPPRIERLEETLIGAYAPLGTRVRATKPGDTAASTFVPLEARELSLRPGAAETALHDVEIPKAVIDQL